MPDRSPSHQLSEEALRDDATLRQLAELADLDASIAQVPPQWAEVSEGARAPQDVGTEVEPDPARRQALAGLFTPISDDRRQSLVQKLADRGADVVPARGRPRWRTPAVVALAAAAAVIFGVLMSRPTAPTPTPLQATYDVELGGTAAMLGESAARNREYQLGDQLTLVALPSRAVRGPIEVSLRASGPAGESVALDFPAQVTADGAVTITGRLDREHNLTPGTWALELSIGRPGGCELNDAAEVCARSKHQLMIRTASATR